MGPLNESLVSCIRGTILLTLRTLFRLRLADIQPLAPGAVILAPNHRSFLDPLVMGSSFSRRVFFLMHAKYYDAPIMNWFFSVTRCIPVEGEGDNRRALREGQDVLDAGRPLCIFPEGTITADGELGVGQPGVAWLARRTGAPVIPVWIGGTREALRKGSSRLRFHQITLITGKPIHISDFAPGRAGSDAFTQAVMDGIAALRPAR